MRYRRSSPDLEAMERMTPTERAAWDAIEAAACEKAGRCTKCGGYLRESGVLAPLCNCPPKLTAPQRVELDTLCRGCGLFFAAKDTLGGYCHRCDDITTKDSGYDDDTQEDA